MNLKEIIFLNLLIYLIFFNLPNIGRISLISPPSCLFPFQDPVFVSILLYPFCFSAENWARPIPFSLYSLLLYFLFFFCSFTLMHRRTEARLGSVGRDDGRRYRSSRPAVTNLWWSLVAMKPECAVLAPVDLAYLQLVEYLGCSAG